MKLANRILLLILVLATFLRIYHIDVNPPAVYGDEISFAVNAWSILKTGVDEWGVRFPLQFRAFDDYKAPLPVYLLSLFFYFGGMNVFTTRLPVVIASVLTILATFLLTRELFLSDALKKINNKKDDFQFAQNMGLIVALLLAISPWHIHSSRGYFEATLALLPLVLGNYFFIKSITKPKFLTFSVICFVVSLYTYFTPRMLLLLWLPFLLFLFRTYLLKMRKELIIAGVLFVFLSLPLVKLTIFDRGSNRLSWFIEERLIKSSEEATREQQIAQGPMILRKALHNRYIVFISNITKDYFEQFSLNFWYLYGDSSLRYFLGKMGMFYLLELPFLLIGLYVLVKNYPRIAILSFFWLMIAAIPTAIAGRPFAVRSISFLPIPFIFVAAGLITFFIHIKQKYSHFALLCKFLVLIGFTLSVAQYILRYNFDYPVYGATWWGWENKAAIDYAKQHEGQYDRIFLSDYYTGMPLAFAYYSSLDPNAYRTGRDHPVTLQDNKQFIQFGKYYIGSLNIDKKRLDENMIPPKTLYIGSPFETNGNQTLTSPEDGRVLFNIHLKP